MLSRATMPLFEKTALTSIATKFGPSATSFRPHVNRLSFFSTKSSKPTFNVFDTCYKGIEPIKKNDFFLWKKTNDAIKFAEHVDRSGKIPTEKEAWKQFDFLKDIARDPSKDETTASHFGSIAREEVFNKVFYSKHSCKK